MPGDFCESIDDMEGHIRGGWHFSLCSVRKLCGEIVGLSGTKRASSMIGTMMSGWARISTCFLADLSTEPGHYWDWRSSDGD